MNSFKNIFLSVLSLVFAGSVAVACGRNSDIDSVEQSSSVMAGSEISSDESSEEDSEESSDGDGNDEHSSENDDSENNGNTGTEHTCITEGTWITAEKGHWLKCDSNTDKNLLCTTVIIG